jgi:hypothetical protein
MRAWKPNQPPTTQRREEETMTQQEQPKPLHDSNPLPKPPEGEPTRFQVGNNDLNGGLEGIHSRIKAGSRITVPRSLAERWAAQGLGNIVDGEAIQCEGAP